MFSIARYQGEDNDEQQDQRTLEKKQERLNQLLEKVNKKRKSPDQPPDNQDMENKSNDKKTIDPTSETARSSKKNKKKKNKHHPVKTDVEISEHDRSVDTSNETQTEKNDNEEEEEEEKEEEGKSTTVTRETTLEESGNDNHDKQQDQDGVLEAFPDMVTNNKQSKEDIQVLRKMGIPEWLLQPTMVTPDQSCSLDSVGLSPSLVMRCQDQGLSSFFAVQMKVIPAFLRRQTFYDTRRAPGDLCISAPTGSGKTLAYVLPIVDILSKRRVTRLRALIVLPTRDLVIQVKETFDAFVQGTDLKVGIALGQHSLSQEQSGLVGKTDQIYEGGLSKVDILIATPGRLMDHLKMTPNFTLQHLRFLVIDEADRLLNQSYQDWLNHILQSTQPQTNKDKSGLTFKTDPFGVIESDAVAPSFMSSCFDLPISDIDLPKAPAVQKLLFSATLTKDPGKIAGLHLTDPEYISVQHDNDETNQPQYTTPAGLKEYMLTCPSAKKPLFLIYLLHHLKIKSGLCFTKSVESTRQLQILLAAYVKQQELDINVVVYSSDLKPAQRKSLLKEFKEGKINLMICSDLIGRGIDLDCVEVVISYDVPLFMDKYIHRVGRTARAGRNGQAFTLVETQEARHFKEMIRKAGHSQQLERFIVDKEQMQTFEEGYQSALAETSQDD